MNALNVTLSLALLLSGLTVPAHADFKYVNSTQMTGGSLYGMMKFAARFTKKGAGNPLDPVVTTYYVKGGRMRTDNPGGVIEIIDLEERRVIQINTQDKTYSTATFDEIKAAMQNAMQQVQQMQQAQQPTQPAKPQDVQVTFQPKIQITPGNSSRVILGQPTTETSMTMDLDMQAQANGQAPGAPAAEAAPAASGPASGQTVSATMRFSMDMYIAPSIAGYQEIGDFYKRMFQEINWVPPSNIHIDPRMEQGMEEFQKNSGTLKGLPILTYITMGLALSPEQLAQIEAAQKSSDNSTQRPNNSADSNSSRNDSIPTTPSGMIVKGLGGMFSKKKQQQQDNSASGDSAQNGSKPGAAPDNSVKAENPGALIEMTSQVTSFSESSLDRSVFEVPSGFAEVKLPPDQVMNLGRGPKAQ